MHRVILAAVIAASTIAASQVEAEPPQGQGFGIGMHSCAEFAAQYRATPTVTDALYLAWAEGWMSGLNAQAAANKLAEKNFSGIDIEALKVELRAYCDSHPLAGYYQGVMAAYLERPWLTRNIN